MKEEQRMHGFFMGKMLKRFIWSGKKRRKVNIAGFREQKMVATD
jgi:hypothetical protein